MLNNARATASGMNHPTRPPHTQAIGPNTTNRAPTMRMTSWPGPHCPPTDAKSKVLRRIPPRPREHIAAHRARLAPRAQGRWRPQSYLSHPPHFAPRPPRRRRLRRVDGVESPSPPLPWSPWSPLGSGSALGDRAEELLAEAANSKRLSNQRRQVTATASTTAASCKSFGHWLKASMKPSTSRPDIPTRRKSNYANGSTAKPCAPKCLQHEDCRTTRCREAMGGNTSAPPPSSPAHHPSLDTETRQGLQEAAFTF